MTRKIAMLEAWLLAGEDEPPIGRLVDEVTIAVFEGLDLPDRPVARGNPYHDKTGKFSSGHGGAAGGVRESLQNASTTEEVATALHDELLSTTGRDVAVDFAGSDVAIAKEHSEGILRGAEKFPNSDLTRVTTGHVDGEAYASTSSDGRVITFSHDAQKYGASGYRGDLKNDHLQGFSSTGTPMGVGVHEYGHSVANTHNLNGPATVHAHDYVEIVLNRHDFSAAVSEEISGYAATNAHEMIGEAFAAVVVNGKSASGLSQDIVEMMDAGIRSGRH